MSFLGEIKRRKMFQVASVYGVTAWLIVQIAATVESPLGLPEKFDTAVIVLLVLGFPVTLVMSWAFNLTSEGLVREDGDSRAAQPGRGIEYVLIALLALAVSYLFVDDYLVGTRAENEAVVTETAAAGPAAAASREALPNSVAVLPLEDLSPDPSNAYYAPGMHAEVISQLTKLENLTVINRESVLRYAENRPPMEEIATDLGVQALLTGTFQYAEGRIRVSMQLVDPGSRTNLWNETYERELADIFAVQASIAMNVANALHASFSPEERERISRTPTDSAAAYRLVLQARDLLRVGGQSQRIHELLDGAISIDPDFAAAHGWKAIVTVSSMINDTISSARGDWDEIESLARGHIERALKADPENAQALDALGALASYSWRWTEARQAYRRAYEITNTVSDPPGIWFRAWSGDPAEAVALSREFTEIAPLASSAHWSHGIVLNYAGDYDAAVESLEEAIALDPTLSLQHSWLALTAIARGNTERARRELESTEQLLGGNRVVISLADLAYGYGRIGDGANAKRLFDEIAMLAEQGQNIGAGGWAMAHLAVGNADRALEWLERGAAKAARHEPDAGYYSLMNIKMNATADPLLERPEFVDVRRRLRGD